VRSRGNRRGIRVNRHGHKADESFQSDFLRIQMKGLSFQSDFLRMQIKGLESTLIGREPDLEARESDVDERESDLDRRESTRVGPHPNRVGPHRVTVGTTQHEKVTPISAPQRGRHEGARCSTSAYICFDGQQGQARSGTVQHGASTVWHGLARSSTERHGKARASTAKHGQARAEQRRRFLKRAKVGSLPTYFVRLNFVSKFKREFLNA
jgi:hypothetical protein